MIRNLILKLLKRFYLKKHEFRRSDLICRKQNRKVLYEVEICLYNPDLQAVYIARSVNDHNVLVSITGNDIIDWEEYRSAMPGTITVN